MSGHAKHWCFTLNNPTPDETVMLASVINDTLVQYIIYGLEYGDNGTPHYQGFISLKKKKRFNQVKFLLTPRVHLEVAEDIWASIQYCKKGYKGPDGKTIFEIEEYGEAPKKKGGRSDLDRFKAAVRAGMLNVKEIRENYSSVYAKSPRFCLEYIADNHPGKSVEDHPLLPWQQELLRTIETPADDRSIVFVVDPIGNKGKSWFAHFCCKKFKDRCQVMLPGKKTDMAYALDPNIDILFIDAPRSKQGEFIQYDFLEDVKNGYVFSPKYESRMKELGRVHLIVNMNEHPDMTKLSQDRYVIIEI
jgi:Putative viral replication protein